MARIAFITRGDDLWGLGHLHRVGWLWQELTGSGVPELKLRAFCLGSRQAKEHWWPDGASVKFTDDPSSAVLAWNPNVVVVDWLDSDPQFVAGLKQRGAKVALLDDYGTAQSQAQLVINALLSPLAPTETTTGEPMTLSGARFVQFPPAVTKLRGVASATANAMAAQLTSPFVRRVFGEAPEQARAVLISFGGQGIAPAIRISLDALHIAKYAGKAIVMPAPADIDHFDTGMLDVEWHPAGPEFHALLAAADVALLAGGLSLYEAAFLGVPAVCIALREHQLATALKLERAGACRLGGRLEQLTPGDLATKLATMILSAELRGRMAAKGMALFDGLGLRRTAQAILQLL